MNPVVQELRHAAAKSFLYSIPLFCISIALDVTKKLNLFRFSPVGIALGIVALVMISAVGYHNWIFRVKYAKCKTYEAQQFANLRSMMQRQEGAMGFNVSSM